MALKIAFDQQVFLLQEYGGISRYICNIAKHFAQTPNIESRVFAPLHFNKNLHPIKNLTHSGLLLPKLHPKLTRISMEASKYIARSSMNSYCPDIIHETYYTHDDFKPKGSKRVLTVYDFIHERYPDMFNQGHLTAEAKKAAVLRADHVICISESTQRDLIRFCGIDKTKTSITYLGVDDIFNSTDNNTTLLTQNSTRPYLLYVGSRAGYKNFAGFIEAFALSSAFKTEFNIVCFGGGAFTKDEYTLANDLGLHSEQLIHYGGSDHVLAQLYREATAFIYPSLYEGFGIPPLEAMASQCPVISSNTSSLPEVIGDAGEYFDPTNLESIVTALENVLGSPSRQSELRTLGTERQKLFSWKKCADDTLAIYRDLL
jgi:glycosyltransferase involved in cell wall biosynthesis